MNIWQRKLLAFLHDPPHKALDIAGHEEARGAFLRQAGFTDPAAIKEFDKLCDATAAAADRFPFPSHHYLKSDFNGDFRHALGGSTFRAGEYQSAALAEDHYQTVQKGWHLDDMPAEMRDRTNFFLHWRRWPVETAQKDFRSYFLPADTRMPDHNIWIHNSLTSALQACVADDGTFAPAFLVFQMGPVQEFIAQARSTRDLWSGSYLLSWLMAHAIKAITDKVGPDAVIFPFLRAQPIFDLLHRDDIYLRIKYGEDTLWKRLKEHENEMLIPNLPNRFFAVVPADGATDLANGAKTAVNDELKCIASACWDWFIEKKPLKDDWRKRYDAQVERFAQVTWQVIPWTGFVEDSLADFAKFGGEAARNLAKLHELAAQGIPHEHRDTRYFSDKAKTKLRNAAFCWSYFYALTDRLLAARRNTRDFAQWKTDDKLAGAVKDSFSGKEEVIGDEDWWNDAQKHLELCFFFRSGDKLGAMNLIKRVWHKAYLEAPEGKWLLDVRKAVAFDSVPAVAAGKWREGFKERLSDAMKEKGVTYEHAVSACEAICRHGPKWGVRAPTAFDETRLGEWLKAVDSEAFEPSTWTEKGREQTEVLAALRSLYATKKTGLEPPPKYYAVIAFDGDEMGKWISGEHAKTALFFDQLSSEAQNYFRKHVQPEYRMNLKRTLAPSYHIQFSEALANFAIYLTLPIVEERFYGQLIYAGGDDVLAMVPATEAINCAQALRAAFRGEKQLETLVPDIFNVHGTSGGFVQLKEPKAEQPSWPLIVPGPNVDASVGIAIGHIKSPLQGMVKAAQDAEKRAKNRLERSAFAVSLFKRSGEILEWGAKWNSGAIEMFDEFVRLSFGKKNGEKPPLSNRFGYALSEALSQYRSPKAQDDELQAMEDVPEFMEKVDEIIGRELDHALERQGRELSDKQRSDLTKKCLAYLSKLARERKLTDFPMLFNVANFIHRGERE